MNKLFIALLVLCSSYAGASANEEAVRFVEEFGIGKNLKPIAARTAMGMKTFKIILDIAGKEGAQKLIVPAMEDSISKYQDDWNASLAVAHLKYFTEDQLKSVREKKKNSPYFSELGKKQALIGKFMQENSKELLVKIVSEAMQKAYENATSSNKSIQPTAKAAAD